MTANGRLPRSALAPVGQGFFLRRDAAEAWNAFNDFVEAQTGQRVSLNAGYRTYARQVYFWNLYKSGRGNLAAYPGTSNHGLGLAVDLMTQWGRSMVDKHGAAFGFSKSWSDAPGEWWHIKFNAGVWRKNRFRLLYVQPLTAEEARHLVRYLALRRQKHPSLARRREHAWLKERRNQIYRAGERTGWKQYRRRTRYHILGRFT